METQDLARKLKQAGIELFQERSGFPLNQAQRNLDGRNHYVDESTLRSFVSKIHNVYVMEDGLILGMVESVQAGPNADSGRVYRPVFFDVFGGIIHRPSIEESAKTIKKAQAEFWQQAEEIDAVEATLDGLKAKQGQIEQELDGIKKLVREIK